MDTSTPNVEKTKLQASLERAKTGGPPSLGQWCEFPGYSLSRTIASLGMDWILVDMEHGNIDDKEMYHMVGGIAAAGVSPIVRIPADQDWMIKRVLDAGAHGIMVPMCETAVPYPPSEFKADLTGKHQEQARLMVSRAKYPSLSHPLGTRGAGAVIAHLNFNTDARTYLSTANSSIVVIVQIESRAGVENCRDIAAVDGIDALFVGPNDLAASLLGATGFCPLDHAGSDVVQQASARVLRAAKEMGKAAGHFALNAEIAFQKASEGWHFMNFGADVVSILMHMGSEKKRFEGLWQVKMDKDK